MNNNLPYKKTRSKHSLAVVFCLVCVGVYGYMLYTVESLRKEALGADVVTVKNDGFDAYKEFYDEAEPFVVEIDRKFAKKGSDVALLEHVERFGEERLQKFGITSATAVEDELALLSALSLTVDGSGSWEEAIRFTRELPQMDFAHSVEKISLHLVPSVSTSTQSLWSITTIIKIPLLSVSNDQSI